MKKILSIVVILLIVLSMIPTIAIQVKASDVDLTLCESTNTQPRGDDPSAAIGIGWTDEDSDPPNAPVLAYNTEYGNGRAFFTGDVNWKDDWFRPYGDNEKLVVNSFDWLSISGKSVLWIERNVYLSYGIDLAYFDGLKALLIANGYTVTKYTGTITSATLSGYDILHIGLGGNWMVAFSTSEIEAIVDFVSAGHGFVLEGENAGCPTEYLNPIAVCFGVTFDKNYVRDPTDNWGRDIDPIIHVFATHPVTSGISEYIPIASCSLTGPAEPPPPVAGKILSVPYYSQGDTMWCLSTSMSMIFKYYGQNIHSWNIAKDWGWSRDEGGALPWTVSGYFKDRGLTTETLYVANPPYPDFDDITSWIDNDMPVLLSMCGIGHAVVIIGYSVEGDSEKVYINDPSSALINDHMKLSKSYPYVAVEVDWNDLTEYIDLFSWLIAVRGTPKPPKGTIDLQDKGFYFFYEEKPWFEQVYSWLSGSWWYGDGLILKNFPLHPLALNPRDMFKFDKHIVNHMKNPQTYFLEIEFDGGWVSETTYYLWSGSYHVPSVEAYNRYQQEIIEPKTIGDLLDYYGRYTITIRLWDESYTELYDEIVFPSIEYRPLVEFSLGSPADLYVTDPQGFHVGVDPSTGQVVNEIPGAVYTGPESEPEVIAIPDPLDGNYVVLLIGTATGTYSLTTELILPEETVGQTSTGETVEGAVYVYTISITDEGITATPDPIAELEHLKEFIDGLPDEAFDNSELASQRKNVLFNKIGEVILKVEVGNYTDAINKLFHDIRAKMDGDSTAQDWIIDPETQISLCVIIDHIISNIKTLQEETG